MKSGLQYGDAFTDGVLTTTCTTCGALRTLTETVEPCACGGRGTATKWTPVKLATAAVGVLVLLTLLGCADARTCPPWLCGEAPRCHAC
jgi:hypothetical protein